MTLSSKHKGTLSAIFAEPTPKNISWLAVEALFEALGAECSEGAGSRLRVALNGVKASFHRPHKKDVLPYLVKSVRRFLENAGITP